MGVVLGIDIGGTRVKTAVVRADDTVIAHDTMFLSPEEHQEDSMVALLARKVGELRRQFPIEAVGIGTAGVIEADTGLIRQSPNFPAWQDFAMARLVGEACGLPVTVDNDANMVAMGEYAFGAGKGARSMLLLTLGSGVGGGLILDGKLFRGEDGMAGEVGHITVEPEGFACNCGNHGCLEQYASSTGLRNKVRRDRFFGPNTDAALQDPKLPEKLYKMAQNSNKQALQYFDEFGYHLAIALGGLLNVLNLHLIVFAGGVSKSMDLWEGRLRQELRHRTFAAVLKQVRIEQAVLGDTAGALGAASMARKAV